MKKNLLLLFFILPLLTFSQKNPNDWTVVATYEIPGKAGGLTYNGEFLYSGLYSSPGDDNLIYEIDPSDGSYQLHCAAPQDKSYGLTFDGTNFWSTDRQGSYDPALAVQFDNDGNLLTSFELPATYISGIEYMDDGTFWVCAYYDPNGTAFHVDASGTVLGQFDTPEVQPWAICQMDDNFWIADYDADMLYLVDETGQVLESHESIGIKPTGVVYDGEFLWYTTGPTQSNSTLYKIDMSGGGNPELSIQPLEFNIGSVILNTNQEFQIDFINTGGSTGIFNTESLTGIGSNFISLNNIPSQIEVAPSQTETVTVDMDFNSPGVFDVVQLFSTNDPLNTNIEVHFFGEITNDGPYIQSNISELNFLNVRNNATTRRWIQIINLGNEDLIIDNIEYGHAFFYTDDANSLPITISQLDTAIIGVWFFPQNTGDFNTSMTISSNDANSPLNIDIIANAEEHDNSIGNLLWEYQITTGYDQSPKAMLAVSDISGDNVGDVIVCSEDYMVRCINGNSSGTADVLWATDISGNVYQQNDIDYLDDIDNDGYDDFIVGTTGGDRAITCLSGKTGDIIWKYYTNEYGDGGWVYQVFGQMDLNNDGVNDALAAAGDDSYDTGPKCIFMIDGTTGEKIWRAPLYGPAFSVIGVADFTGDGFPDVIAGASNEDESQGKVVGINGVDGQVVWTFNTTGTSVWALTELGDINGDQIPDIMAGDFSGNYYFLDATNGNELQNGSIGNKLILRFLNLDDINEDGYNDILIASSSTITYLIDGFSADPIWSVPLSDKSWNLAVANDLNDDGFNDLMAGTLYSNNYSYFLDGSNGDEMSKKAADIAIDALIGIEDVCGDYTMEMVAGDRNGKLSCYSGGLDGSVAVEELESDQSVSAFIISPNPVSNEFNIDIEWSFNETITLELIESSSGKTWLLGEIQIKEGKQHINLQLPSSLKSLLSSGIYLLRISGLQDQQQEKFIYIK